MSPISRTAFAATLLALSGVPALFAQTGAPQDIAPVNTAQFLQDLKQIAPKRGAELNALKSQAYQAASQLANAAGNAQTAWESAIQATQFQGLPNDAALFHEWKEKTSDARKNPETAVALHLYFNWLALTLQHSMGAETKDLLPTVIAHAREAIAYQTFMDQNDESMRRERDALKEAAGKEGPRGGPGKAANPRDRDKLQDEAAFKKYLEDITNTSLGNSAYAQWQHLEDVVNDVAPARKRGEKADTSQTASTWSPVPADVDGIYSNIILPELRAQRDARAIEYWDSKLRREADLATRSKLPFQIDQFNNERRPQLLWSRAQEFAWIGMKNRAATEMLNIIKTTPASPATAGWITELQSLLVPPPAPPASQTSAASTGVVPPPLPGAQ